MPFTPLVDGQRFVAAGLDWRVIEVPGHTAGHLAFWAEVPGQAPVLLCGDTLFSAGCGRIFDGTVTLVLVLKTLCFALAVSVTPMASALQDMASRDPHPASAGRESAALQGLVRLFAVLLLLEALSLVGTYY